MPEITPFLWFDDQAEEAVDFYVSLFEASRILEVTHYGEAGPRPSGTVMTIGFELAGRRFIALNGGPEYRFTEAISLFVECEDQAAVDRLWAALTDEGEEGPCGWLKDRYGLSWQIVPKALLRLLSDRDPERVERVMGCVLQMRRLDVAELERAAAG